MKNPSTGSGPALVLSHPAGRCVGVPRALCALLLLAVGVALSAPAAARPHAVVKHPPARASSETSGGWRTGSAAIVVDGNTGKVMHESNADALRHPASVTKIMTLFLLFEQLDKGRLKLDSRLNVSPRAAAQEPTRLGLRPGSTIEVEDAIKAVVTRSANDAAVVIAEAIAGDEASFAAQMTRKARALGMSRTTFKNASGLPNAEQVTTARDLSLLGRAIQERYPRYYRFFSTRQFAWHGDFIPTHNRLLGRVPGVDGIKTGYTRASGYNLVTSLKRDGRYLVAVVLGGRSGGSRDEHMESLLNQYMPKAYAGGKIAPRIADTAEVATASTLSTPPLPPERPAAISAPQVSAPQVLASAARPEPAASGLGPMPVVLNEPLRPVAVHSVAIGPVSATAPLGAIVTRPSPGAVPVYTTTSAAPGQIAPTVITIAPTPAPQATAPQTAASNAPARPGAIVAAAPAAPASATPPAPAVAPRSAENEWMIQIGAFAAETQARDRLREAQTRAKHLLGAADPFTVKVVKGSTALYRARFAGFDEHRAREACRVLKASDFACMPLKN